MTPINHVPGLRDCLTNFPPPSLSIYADLHALQMALALVLHRLGYLINRSSQQIKEGTKAFLFELNRLVGDARVESSKRAVKRVNTDLVKGTIQVIPPATQHLE